LSFDIFLMDFIYLLFNLILIKELLDDKILFGNCFMCFLIFEFDIVDDFLPYGQDFIKLI
jgi:hypothetical protein